MVERPQFPPFSPPLYNQGMCSLPLLLVTGDQHPCLSSEVVITATLEKSCLHRQRGTCPQVLPDMVQALLGQSGGHSLAKPPSGNTAKDGGPDPLREKQQHRETSADQENFPLLLTLTSLRLSHHVFE